MNSPSNTNRSLAVWVVERRLCSPDGTLGEPVPLFGFSQ